MKIAYCMAIGLVMALAGPAAAQTTAGFARGEKSSADNHVGAVWLNELSAPDSTFQYSVALATFDKSARLDWHVHPAGQILLITAGEGYYQERGKPRRTVRQGEVIKCSPGVEHWHGATPTSGVAYLATTPAQKGKTIWLKRLTAQEYAGSN